LTEELLKNIYSTLVGKSTFINSLRNLSDVKPSSNFCYREDESAPVNRGFSEVTSHIRRYIWPNNEYAHLALWDSPGGSTKSNRAATYFQDKALYAFDCILLLCTARFTELDFDIVLQACNCGTPIVLVLTKVDQEVKNEIEENPDKPPHDIVNEIVSEFKQSARKKLAEVHPAFVNVPLYAVSATKFRKELNHQATNECSSLEMLELLQYCSNVATYRRSPFKTDDHGFYRVSK
jgi:predicted GTPase